MAAAGKDVMMHRLTVRKGLSFTMIGGIILALVGVGILIMMFSNTFGSGFQGTFCAVYGGLGALMPGDSAPPKGCGANDDVSYEAIRCPEIEQCQLKFSSTIANCWQDYQGYMTESETCQGWNVKTLDGGPLTEGMIHDEMEENDICPQQISCDAPGPYQVRATINGGSGVQEGDFVIIEYRSDPNTGEEWVEIR
jgi:hypothetical protein